MLLSIPDQRPTVDLAPDSLLHHLPSVELAARVYRVHAHRSQVIFAHACDDIQRSTSFIFFIHLATRGPRQGLLQTRLEGNVWR